MYNADMLGARYWLLALAIGMVLVVACTQPEPKPIPSPTSMPSPLPTASPTPKPSLTPLPIPTPTTAPMPSPSTEPSPSLTPQVVFEYGRWLQYWTEDDVITIDKAVKGFERWRLALSDSKEQQEYEVILRSPLTFPSDKYFEPQRIEKEGPEYLYTLEFTASKNDKPGAPKDEPVFEPIFIPHLSNTWSQFNAGLNVYAHATLSDSQKGAETVTIKITPQRAFSQIWVSLETGKDAILLADTASPPMGQWNISSPQLNKTYTFSVQLQIKNFGNEDKPYKPKVNIGAMTVPVQQTEKSGQSLTTEIPGLGSLQFQTAKPTAIRLNRNDQVIVYLWQPQPFTLSAPLKGWGFCKSFDDKQNPVGSSLLYSPSDNQVAFWANYDVQAFEEPPSSGQIEWIDPSGQISRTTKVQLTANIGQIISDIMPLQGSATLLGAWRVRLTIDGELVLTTSFSLVTPPTPIATASPLPVFGFVVGDKPFQFLGATVQNQWNARTGPSPINDPARIEVLIKSAKANGITVLQPEPPLFEPALGVYQEFELVKLDRLLDSASRNGVYVIIPFIHAYGIALSPDANPYYHPSGIEGLIKDQRLRQAFKKRIAMFITRTNTVNDRKYSEDPTIMAWLLCEEIVSASENYKERPPQVQSEEMAAWVEEMASYVKSLDTNHLLAIDAPSAISKGYGDNWSAVFQSQHLDFLTLGDAEGSIIHLTQDDDKFDFRQKVFALGKPVTMQFSFDGGYVNQKLFSKDYVWQAENLRKIFKAYYEMGVAAGFTIYSWGSDLDMAFAPDKTYTYTASNQPIAQAFLDIALTLGRRNSTTLPLQPVKLNR